MILDELKSKSEADQQDKKNTFHFLALSVIVRSEAKKRCAIFWQLKRRGGAVIVPGSIATSLSSAFSSFI